MTLNAPTINVCTKVIRHSKSQSAVEVTLRRPSKQVRQNQSGFPRDLPNTANKEPPPPPPSSTPAKKRISIFFLNINPAQALLNHTRITDPVHQGIGKCFLNTLLGATAHHWSMAKLTSMSTAHGSLAEVRACTKQRNNKSASRNKVGGPYRTSESQPNAHAM